MNYDYRNFRRGGALRKFTLLTLVSALAVMTTLFSCSTRDVQARGQALDQKTQDALKKYWNRGGAELTAYKLSQARYGESHPGFAVLVFVTEEFLTDKQVKLESKWRPAAAPILKLNFVRKFLTGIYKYSAMTSVFTPLDTARYPQSLKVTTSMQEWCGHIFQQFNLRDNRYKVQGYSYFEDEGDSKYELEAVHMEDDFWTRLRLSPELLPTGKIKIIPGTYFARLRHVKSKVEEALASREVWKKSGYPGKNLMAYRLKYPALERELVIIYEKEFPHRIAGYQDRYKSGFGPDAEKITTRAVRTKEIYVDYWAKHDLKDRVLRKKLGLPESY